MRPGTEERAYAERLARLSAPRWKRWLDVQRPYRWHLRSLRLGFTLEVGCGIGRNLAHLGPGAAVGVDHNPVAIDLARARGLEAYLPDEFRGSARAGPGRFDALLLAHVLEHMDSSAAAALVREYLPYVRAGGRVVAITPQEAGWRSDPTHVDFMDFERVAAVLRDAALEIGAQYSFPFPRPAGKVFRHNEFVTVARKR